MFPRSHLGRLRASIAAFARAEQGNVAVIFALALLPIVGFIGAAVDYSRANYVRSSMQAAIDSTALMLSQEAASLSKSQLTEKAATYFNAIYKHPEGASITITAKYSANSASGATLKIDGEGSVATIFLKAVGFSTIPITSSATSSWGSTRLRVALALDNTGSMVDAGKMDALKTAAKNLVDQLSSAAKNPGDVYVSVVPFSLEVNVGTANVSQSWIAWDKWDSATNYYTSRSWYCSDRYSFSRAICLGHSKTWSHSAPSSHSSWNGCVTDRDQPYDADNTLPAAAQPATLYPADQDPDCPTAALMPLSYDWSALKNRIDSMSPVGATNQPIGLVWAWNSLMTTAPLNAPYEDTGHQYKKIIVLLSDGLNTYNRWYGDGVSTSSQVDARQALLCTNIKAAGITIYTVQVNTGTDPLSTTLQNCASGSDKFFLLTSANQIVSTFNQIGTAISQLRISK